MTPSVGPSERPGGTAPHVLVEDLERPVLRSEDRHHLARVRRVRDGDPVSVTDGMGGWRWCAFADELVLTGPIVVDPVPAPVLTVAFALVKGQRPELVVQKLTEVGIDVIVPFVAARSVVQWDGERSTRNHDRLAAVAREAAQQSRRTWFPVVEAVANFEDVAARPGAVQAEAGGRTIGPDTTTVLIGPEGGWSDDELRLPVIGLGPTVLRAETAAIAAGVLLAAHRHRWIG